MTPSSNPWASRPFRLLFGLWIGANLCGWMHEAASGWLMASLYATPFEVALLQAFTAFPAFLLALPSGALSDLVDRGRIIVLAYSLVTVASFAVGISILAGYLSPGLLLIAALAMGVTFALRLPAYASLMQEVLPRIAVPRAIVWNGASMNASRIFGPSIVGIVIAWGEPAYVYLINGCAMLALTVLLLRWRRPRTRASTLPSERFFGAIRVGLQFARQTPALRAVLIRSFAYFFFAIVPLALLPVVVRDELDGESSTYTMLFGLFGLGAIIVVPTMQWLRTKLSGDQLVGAAVGLQALAALAFALSTNIGILALAMVAAGYSWLAVASVLSVTAQFVLPAWVRGRGLAAVQMAFMGGGAFGAAIWGQVANTWSIPIAFGVTAASSLASIALIRWYPVTGLAEEDLTPSRYWPEPAIATSIEHDEGPVQVMVEYLIDPVNEEPFTSLMQESRRLRLRSGAISWALFRDPANAGRYVEQWVEESWLEFLRHRDRLTLGEQEVRDRKRAFHIAGDPPVWTYLVATDLARRRTEAGATAV